MTYDTLLKLQELEIVQRVEDHADELIVETHPNIRSRLVTRIPTSVVPGLHQISNVFHLDCGVRLDGS